MKGANPPDLDEVEPSGSTDEWADEAPAEAAGGSGAARRRRRPRGRTLVALGLVTAVGGWYLAYGSPLTLVEHVVVDAPRGLSEESIRLASGISAQDHVPAVDAAEVRLAVMTAIPAIADVRVTRSLPDTIRLDVTPRTPLAALASGKGFYVMDADGVIYDRVKDAKRLPVIRSSSEVGREVARTVLVSLPEKLRRKVVKVSAGTRDDVTLTLRGDVLVRWGSAEDAELKAKVLEGLTQVKAQAYDVSAPLLPTTSQPSE